MPETERRREPRLRALKAGRAVLAGGRSTFDCMVRNLSPIGAKVVFESTADIPPRFSLRFQDGTAHDCAVKWRTQREMGVEFVEAKTG
ncbi:MULTISPECIES: PilZ domain-containing protein [Rhizobium]|uniref:PilZ domain-containing protein n=1 Tax=Rhizobium wuzhouense TaxID=1986026 RepID=A0ABX5NNK8_9HYPH|nr:MULTISPECIES: PilZ domain-containing protein [Rhizobium]PYB71424.1 PilZ domain-containing protein [Rhizobium wuzhouense]RKE85032.1 PilZ domain-containing protein [Rhizobium sp. AG855]